ncbi:DUF134 domain-containing protein [Brockia lithotrophica]|uniref:UPF0251 protein C7438_1668 n=1 Tax=Brockia lithotrophica TaxID=933949 RepID=A0A660KUV8_9BACL|nr:DUF134 domain-containing protein [Brockia lithotrophica]RKQ83638.1 putative DNA-binding protein (UPF0251 family) [Brockia lithotrophica]
MPRPRKRRRVCFSPEYREFGPLGQGPWTRERTIHMPLEELETIRLIDLEGLTQEECAARMGVARSTVQRMYQEARRKIAESLVLGKRLVVHGDAPEFEGKEDSRCPDQFAGADSGPPEWPPGWGRRRRGRGVEPWEGDE